MITIKNNDYNRRVLLEVAEGINTSVVRMLGRKGRLELVFRLSYDG